MRAGSDIPRMKEIKPSKSCPASFNKVPKMLKTLETAEVKRETTDWRAEKAVSKSDLKTPRMEVMRFSIELMIPDILIMLD